MPLHNPETKHQNANADSRTRVYFIGAKGCGKSTLIKSIRESWTAQDAKQFILEENRDDKFFSSNKHQSNEHQQPIYSPALTEAKRNPRNPRESIVILTLEEAANLTLSGELGIEETPNQEDKPPFSPELHAHTISSTEEIKEIPDSENQSQSLEVKDLSEIYVFMYDVTDGEKFNELKKMLSSLQAKEKLHNKNVILIANKLDTSRDDSTAFNDMLKTHAKVAEKLNTSFLTTSGIFRSGKEILDQIQKIIGVKQNTDKMDNLLDVIKTLKELITDSLENGEDPRNNPKNQELLGTIEKCRDLFIKDIEDLKRKNNTKTSDQENLKKCIDQLIKTLQNLDIINLKQTAKAFAAGRRTTLNEISSRALITAALIILCILIPLNILSAGLPSLLVGVGLLVASIITYVCGKETGTCKAMLNVGKILEKNQHSLLFKKKIRSCASTDIEPIKAKPFDYIPLENHSLSNKIFAI